MKTIAIITQKGGSGKTTLAVHLAVCAIQKGKSVVLVDLDPQGSAIDWFEARQSINELAAIHTHAEALPDLLKRAKKGNADLVVIDTAPHSDKAATIAAKVADFILIPCRPARFDLKAIDPTFKIVRLTKTPAAVVINNAPRGKIAEQIRELLRSEGYPVLDLMISQRAAFLNAVFDGRSVHEYEPEGVAASEIDALFDEISKRLNL